jgi:hypothetical protein
VQRSRAGAGAAQPGYMSSNLHTPLNAFGAMKFAGQMQWHVMHGDEFHIRLICRFSLYQNRTIQQAL